MLKQRRAKVVDNVKQMEYYVYTIKCGFKSKIIYRLSAWLGSISGIITFLIQILIWKALLGNGVRFDTTFEIMLTYLVITQIASAFVNSFSGATIARLIRNGDISLYLVRPINLKIHLFFDDFGKNIFNVFIINLPVCFVLICFWGFQLPNEPIIYCYVILMLINGMFLLFHYKYILGVLTFWLIKNPFTTWGFQNAESIFSGKVLPIWLCPTWLVTVTKYLPFRYFTYEAVALFVGKASIESVMHVLIVQYFWIIMFLLLEHIISKRAINKLVVQGG
jgi:ABC-2 type transport system permease protein